MLGRTPGNISAIRPLKDGVIADFDVTEQMLRHFIQKVHQNRWAHPRVVVCVPSGVTGVEKRAVEEATLSAGARSAFLIEEPMAAAIGAGLPVAEPTGNMVVDIGGGTTEVAVISLGGIVVAQSIRVGGDELDEAIISYVKKEYKLMIGSQTAEEVKLEIGSAYPLREEVQAEIRGRDMITGLPKTVVLSSEDVREALEEPLRPDHRRRQEHARQDPAGAGLRHHGPRDHDGRRRIAAAGPRRAAAPRDRDADPRRRVAADLRRRRLRPLAGGVRGDAEGVVERPTPEALLRKSRLMAVAATTGIARRRANVRRIVIATLVIACLAIFTGYFRESTDGPLHGAQIDRREHRRARAGGGHPRRRALPRRLGLGQQPEGRPRPGRRARGRGRRICAAARPTTPSATSA